MKTTKVPKLKFDNKNDVTIVIGGRETGVTTENKNYINGYVKNKKSLKEDYRVLVIDFDNEYKGKRIDVEAIKMFKNKIAIIGSSEMTIKERAELIKSVNYNYRDGLLVIEDMRKSFLKKSEMFDVMSSLYCGNHKKVKSVLCLGHTFCDLPSHHISNISNIRLHQTKSIENDGTLKKVLGYGFVGYKLAMSIVNNKQFTNFVMIDRENNTISGHSFVINMDFK